MPNLGIIIVALVVVGGILVFLYKTRGNEPADTSPEAVENDVAK